MDGITFPVKAAFSGYMTRWYNGSVYGDTPAVKEFLQRGLARSMMWAPARMVDAAEDMLAAYRKNENGPKGANSLLPVVLVAMAKDYNPTGSDMGGHQVRRQLIAFDEGPDASMYGYRQAEGDVRTQVLIMAGDEPSAKSLAAQFSWYVAQLGNRRFKVQHTFGQYSFELSATVETPEITFMAVANEQKNLTMLVADLTIRTLFPFLDAPMDGQPNDGSTNNPPGYPRLQQIDSVDEVVKTHGQITEDGIDWL